MTISKAVHFNQTWKTHLAQLFTT